ncbi:hypothetical protein GCM10020221_19250 [Streptomyces thioluteus]|uniref:Tetratricopeptide repeat protein n=1 Tax=Streptomyces thioluteus TaxID=66431 RepID=A0ABN3WPL4_STRTU
MRAAQAAQQAGRRLGSARLMSLLALRRGRRLVPARRPRGVRDGAAAGAIALRPGPSDADPEWMTFFGEAELEGLEAQCWSALGDRPRAVAHGERAVALADPHFARNIALYTAQLADDLAQGGAPEAAAEAGERVLALLRQVRSTRIGGCSARRCGASVRTGPIRTSPRS